MKLPRTLPSPLALLVSALLLLAIAVAFLFGTEHGLRVAAALAQEFSGGALRIGAVQGQLLGECLIDDLHYVGADGLRLDIHRIHLRLSAHALLRGRLQVRYGEIDGFALTLPLHPSPSPPLERLPQRLPLDLAVDDFRVSDLRITRGDEELFGLPRADLTGSWVGDTLDITRLDAELPQTGLLHASAAARMQGDRLDISRLAIHGPGELEAQGVLGIGKAASDLRLQWQGLRWPFVGTDPLLLAGFDGTLHVTGPFTDYHYELHGSTTLHKVPVKLNADGDGNLDSLRFASLGLDAGKGSLYARGRVAWAPAPRADLNVQFTKLDPGLFAADWRGALSGAASTQTILRDGQPEISFAATLAPSTLRGQPLSLTAQGRTDLRGVMLERFRLRSGKGGVEGGGSVVWSPALKTDTRLTITHFDPAQFLPQWPGDLNGTLTTHTATRGRDNVISFDAQFAGSRLRAAPLTLTAQGELAGEHLQISNLDAALGATRLKAGGAATTPFDLSGHFDSSDLSPLYPNIAGSASFDFKLQGTLAQPHLVTRGQAHGLRYQTYRVATLAWNADLAPKLPSQLDITASDAAVGMDVRSARLSVTGVEAYQHIRFDADTAQGALSLSADGGYNRQRREWGGQLGAARIAPVNLPAWTLEHPAGVLLGARRQSVEPACLSGEGGRACLRLEQNVLAQGLRLSWQLDQLHLAALQGLLPRHYQLQGEANGAGRLDFSGGDVRAMQARLALSGAQVRAPDGSQLQLLPSTLTLSDERNTLRAQLDLRSPQGVLSADLSAGPAAALDTRPLSGEVHIGIPDLAFVSTLVPELRHVAGHIDGDLQAAGTVGLPRVKGQVVLDGGQAQLVTPGTTLKDAQLSLSGDGEGPLALHGTLTSGGGTLTLSGSVDPHSEPPRADLTLKGDNVQAMATADARIWVSPDLHLLDDTGGIHLDGSIAVPKAEITPHGLGEDRGISASPDQVIVGAPAPAPSKPLPLYANLDVTLGDQVSVDAFGLTTRLTGAVTLNEQPQSPTSARGELQLVDGRYKAYGQDLRIETGRLIFSGGPVTQPAVDLYAVRHPQQDITVGVRVRGTLDKPELTLQSDPAMPREQQLSWLVLGHSLDQGSSADRNAMSQAALSLGLSGSGALAQKFGKDIGIDQVSVGQAPVGGSEVAADATQIAGSQAAQGAGSTTVYTTQAAQLTLGKYLTPKLLVSYGVSLFQPGQTFRLLYDLGHGFKLQTESGVASGGDLLYTFER